MSFNIGSQTGGVINNVAGDQYVSGRQSGVAVSLSDAQTAAQALQTALAAADLSELGADQRTQLTTDADAIVAEVHASDPPQESIRDRLARITSILRDAGALAGAAAAIVGPVTELAQWLGPLGASVLALLA